MNKEFSELISNYFEYPKDEFIKKLSKLIQSSDKLKKEIGYLLNFKDTPLYLKELLISTIKQNRNFIFFKYLKKFILETDNNQLYQMAIDSISKIISYETEIFLLSLKQKSLRKSQPIIQQSLNNIYKFDNIRMLRVLLSERDDRVLFYKGYEYFVKNPDQKIIPYILPLLLDQDKEIRESIVQILIKTGFCNTKVFNFISNTIEKIMDKNIDMGYKKKLIYLLSYLCSKNEREKFLIFLDNIKKKYGDIFIVMEPFAYIPLEKKRYKNYYIGLFSSESNDNKYLVLKHLPIVKEKWVIDILRAAFNTRVPLLVKQAFWKMHQIKIENMFFEDMKKLPFLLKKEIISFSSEKGILMDKELVKYLFEEEKDELGIMLIQYLKKVNYPNVASIIEKMFFCNFSTEFKKEALKLYTKGETEDKIINLLKKLIDTRGRGSLKEIEIVVITIIKKLLLKNNLKEENKELLLDFLLIIFEETLEEQILVLILLCLKEFPLSSQKQYKLIVEELKDKQKVLLNIHKDMTNILKMIKEAEKELNKKNKFLELRKELRKEFLISLRQLRNNKNAILKIRDILRKDSAVIEIKEEEFLKQYILNEIMNPFQNRGRRVAMLDLIVILNIKEAKELLIELFNQSIPDLKISIKNTLIQLQVPPQEFLKKEKPEWIKKD